MKKLAVVAIALAAAVTVAGTGLSAEAAAKKPTKITLKSTAKTVDVKGNVTVSVKSVKPSKASKSVSYKTSNKKIATVSSKGVVTGKKAGKVTITATSKVNKKVKATIKITVKNLKPTSVSVSPASVSLKVGATKTIKTTVKPTGVYCPVTYKSSDSSVATVTSKGKITAKKAGTATITVKTKEKNSKGKYLSKKVKVTVKAKQEETTTKVEAVTQRQVYVSPEWVQSALNGEQEGYENLFVSEVKYGTTENDKNYNAGHIPGAVHINSDAVEYDDWNLDGYDDQELYGKLEVSSDDNFNIRSSEQLAEFLKANGITKDTKVVLYGTSSKDSSVTRVAFAMIYAGVEDVKVIDGGLTAWKEADLPLETTVNEAVPGGDDYSFGTTIPAHPEYLKSIDDVKDQLSNDDNFRLVSIRSYDEFVGNESGYDYITYTGEPAGAIWGHDSSDYVEDGKVIGIDKVSEILAESYSSLDNELSFYCGTGWRATIPFLICYQEGMENISLYDGGWWQWQVRWQENADEWPIQKITPEEAAANLKAEKVTNYITSADLMADMQSDSQTYKVLDVRKAADYATAHVPGSISADVDGAKTGEDVDTATANIKAAISGDSEDTKYVVICYSGNAYAKAATKLLKAAGVKNANIYTLQGGMKSWNADYSNYTVKTYTTDKGFTFENGVTLAQLKADVDAENSLYTIFDLRDAVTYASGHIASAVSTPLKEYDSGSDLSDEDAKANLQAGIDANPNGYYVLECYSGNTYANNAVNYLKELGVSSERILVFEDGASAWTKADYDVTKSTVPVKYDAETKTITLYGVLNETYLTTPTKHYMSTTGATLGNQCLFEGLNDRVEFAEVLEKLGAEAWNTTPKAQHGIKNADGETTGGYISADNADNKDYTHVEVSLTWSGQDTPVSMADTLTTTDGSKWPIDEVFSNSSEVAKGYGSGCLLCTCSCYAGAVTNEDMPFVTGSAIKSMGNADVLSSAKGKIVTFTITLK